METLRSFLSQISLPILVSAVTSALVGLTSFLVGNRFAKERSDRGALRELYRDLLQHLSEMSEAIGRGNPRRWSDYPVKNNRYVPTAADMKKSGRLALVEEKQASRYVALEEQALIGEGKYRKWIETTLKPRIEQEFEKRVTAPEKLPVGGPYLGGHVYQLALKGSGDTEKTIERIQAEGIGWSVDLALERGKSRTLYARPETIKQGSIGELIEVVEQAFIHDSEGQALREALLRSQTDLEAEVFRLEKRIREPQPFWETIGRAFADLGRS